MDNDHKTVRILLADSHSLFREAVKGVLQSEPDLKVVAEADDGLQAVAEAERAEPDVAVLNADLPNCDGLRAAEQIAIRAPGCRVLLLSDEEDERILQEAFEAGASGYLTKKTPLADLIDATRAVSKGEPVIPRHMLGPLLAGLIRRRRQEDDARRRASRLTRREREVLALLTNGADNDAIVRALVISPQTARTHIRNVLGKLGVHSRLQAAAFVLENGILEDLVEVDG